uniref:Uncharacterized protein n=1 Tax=Oryza punctata TaxID=4537 RepID=A0A0E0JKM1_ORYPU
MAVAAGEGTGGLLRRRVRIRRWHPWEQLLRRRVATVGDGSGDCGGHLGPPPYGSGDGLKREANGGSPPPSPVRIRQRVARWRRV